MNEWIIFDRELSFIYENATKKSNSVLICTLVVKKMHQYVYVTFLLCLENVSNVLLLTFLRDN